MADNNEKTSERVENSEHPQKQIERMIMEKQDQEQGVVFNGKPCRNGCNCVEVEAYHHGEQSLKRGFECLGSNDFNKLKSKPTAVAEPVKDYTQQRKEIAAMISQNKDDLGRTIISGLVTDFLDWHQKQRSQKTSSLEAEIGELLAIMHGDGGHYQSKNGTEKAIKDAIKLLHIKWVTNEHLIDINQVSAENKRLNAEIERLEDQLKLKQAEILNLRYALEKRNTLEKAADEVITEANKYRKLFSPHSPYWELLEKYEALKTKK